MRSGVFSILILLLAAGLFIINSAMSSREEKKPLEKPNILILLADSLTPVELFNLSQDHREIYNLLGKKLPVEKELTSEIKKFLSAGRLNCCP